MSGRAILPGEGPAWPEPAGPRSVAGRADPPLRAETLEPTPPSRAGAGAGGPDRPQGTGRRPSPSLLAIIGEGLFSRLSFGLISFALPLYARHLGLDLTETGFLISLNLAVALALKPLMGWTADRLGLKPSFMTALGLRSLVSLLLAFAASPWQLYAVRAVHGVSISLRDPSANALLAEHGGKGRIASAFAWYQTAKSVAAALSRGAAGMILTFTGSNYSLVFLAAFALSALPLALVGPFVREERGGDGAGAEASSARLEPGAREGQRSVAAGPRPALVPFVGLSFLVSGTGEMLHGLFPILATEYAGLTEAEAGIISMASTFALRSAETAEFVGRMLLSLAASPGGLDLDDEHVVAIEPDIHRLGAVQALHEEPRAGEQHHRERALSQEQHVQHPRL